MLFNSLSFAVFFLICLSGYWALPTNRLRLGWLLLLSWVFYAAWYPAYLLLFVLVMFLNYAAGRVVGAFRQRRPKWAARVVAATVVLDLGLLGFFKYVDFLTSSLFHVFSLLGISPWAPPLLHVFLPLGISFYTFQLIAYVVDVNRGDCPVIRNPFMIFVFISFFPHQIAGPILRVGEFMGQLEQKRRFNPQDLLHGLDLIAFGLLKKALIADQLAPFVDRAFSAPDGLGAGTLLLAVYAYAVQIYCDFSGYTDIGRGCAFCLGYKLPINFAAPYFSVNIVEFWRRWHITLSRWLRDYLYIPLGGNRLGRLRTYANLLITMVLGGLWHGASWNFVVWGALHGIALAFTRFVHEWRGVAPHLPLLPGKFYRILSILFTFHLVCLGWVFFRAPTFDAAFTILREIATLRLFGTSGLGSFGFVTLALVAAAVFAAGAMHLMMSRLKVAHVHQTLAWTACRPFVYFAVTAAIPLLADRGAQQFIYFQF